MQGNASHMLQFLASSKKSYKLSQKTVFLTHFRFFVYTFLCPLNYARTFCHSFLIGIHSNEGWTVTTEHMKLRNRVKFHQYTICGCQVNNFQSSAYQISIHAGLIFERFLGHYSGNYGPILLIFGEVVF